jgi:hypothetical protein
VAVLADSYEGKPFCPNDLVVDKKGGVHFQSPARTRSRALHLRRRHFRRLSLRSIGAEPSGLLKASSARTEVS